MGEETIFEIGPGKGSVTKAMEKRGANVIAVEKDHRLSEAYGWIEGDILTYDLEQLPKCKVVSNLPYHLTSPILARLLPRRDLFTTLTVIVQKEMGERMVASPGSKSYGRFSIFNQFYADVKYAFTIGPNAFSPKPKVESAVIHLTLKEPPQVDEAPFFELVKKAFQTRRKMVGKTIGKTFVVQAGIDPTLRPEMLSLDDFLKINQFYSAPDQTS
ncbi:MAG: Ribosomal RNA small subunit methyltransferase A [Chlamydiales bacterium]|nr:Ribosomal RNA small subunit methyltransferase A [Chlamydiales bacterium]MCH9620064.1 Ribosomal RNA small subunit methyltransferase A [Chlamydiales bacterium]MCH9623517.1 Ribosomal RNA small subunit methyltransferase A [Chlamydiales bacterium]